MTDPQWENLKQIFHAALSLPPQQRAAYLEQACLGDASVKEEVESLLKSHEETNNFIDTPAYQAAAEMLVATHELKSDQQIAHYQIISRIGEGGMGVVYLAEDLKLHRRVALKFLSRTVTQDQERLARFEQEARAASALNHPNILTIHEIGEAAGHPFIATEYIEGQTLRERLHSGISINDALEIAIQIASALVAAHRVNVVHRDIKPENIMIRHDDGLVKVLDFGLAKVSVPGAVATGSIGSVLGAIESRSVAREAERQIQDQTQPGVVMGTVAYMSPEQARGDTLDERTDIWSLGVVLYEMLAGCPPFHRSTPSEVIALVAEREPPPLAQYAQEVPSDLERIVSKALIKNREDRYHTAKDFFTDLRRVQRQLDVAAQLSHSTSRASSGAFRRATGESQTVATMQASEGLTDAETVHPLSRIEFLGSHISRHKWAALVAVGTIVVVTTALSLGWKELASKRQSSVKSATPLQTMKIKRLTSDGQAMLATISPDGKYLVHVSDNGGQQSLWMRQVTTTHSTEKQILPPADVRFDGLTFSPDGDSIYYTAAVKEGAATLYRMPALGGASEELIVDIDTPVTFSPDGHRISFDRGYPDQGEDALLIANADGTGERKLATRKGDYWWPAWSPDGKIIASRATNPGADKYRTVVGVQVDDGVVKPINSMRWWQIGEMVWLRDGSGLVMTASEQESDPLQIWFLSYPGGAAHKITNDLNDYGSLGLTADSNGLLAAQLEGTSNIWIVPHGDSSRATQLTFTKVDGFKGMSWTPDSQLVYESWASGNAELWSVSANGSNPKQLTADSRHNADPVVSPDGKYVVFYSNRAGHNNIWKMDIDGSNLKQLTDGPGEQFVAISPDGQWVVYTSILANVTLWKVPIDGGNPVQLTDKPSSKPTVSPDGKLIACNYMEKGRWKVAVIPFEGGQPIIMFDSFTYPLWLPFHWTPDGRALAYINQRNRSSIWSVSLSGGPPKLLLDFKSGRVFDFAWSRGGSQLAVARGEVTSNLVLISNFRE